MNNSRTNRNDFRGVGGLRVRPAHSRTRPHPRRPTRHLAATAAVALACLLGTSPAARAQAHGQAHNQATFEPPLVAVHYQDLLAGEDAVIDLFVPPPLVAWHEFSYAAADCLAVQGVHQGPPGKVLIVRLQVADVGTCTSSVELHFGDGENSWPASAVVVVNRLPDLEPLEDLDSWFRSDRINLPGSATTDRAAVLLLMGLTNTRAQPLTLLGFGNDHGFVSAVGQVFRYDPDAFFGRYEDLVRSGSPFEPTELAPGESASFALILDPQRHMPSGSGTLTARPVVLLQLGGQRHTLQFPRLSTAWGVELP